MITPASVTSRVVTSKTAFPEGAVRDCVVAMIAIKYTQVSGYGRVGWVVGGWGVWW